MRFTDISELELSKLFVHAKKEKIEKLLGITNLNTCVAAEILCVFIKKNSDKFWNIYMNKYTPLFDEEFFYMVINEFKKSQRKGLQLDAKTQFVEPKITYVS